MRVKHNLDQHAHDIAALAQMLPPQRDLDASLSARSRDGAETDLLI